MTRPTRPSPRSFPALAAFLSGYLHEDFALDYRTPDGARRAFEKDASDKERRALRDETKRFRDLTKDWARNDRLAAFTGLGAAWLPASDGELTAFLEALARPPRRKR
jgi:hypothetical protein